MKNKIPMCEATPYLWLDNDEPVAIAECGCKLVANELGSDSALFRCENCTRAVNEHEGLISENAVKSAVISQLSKQNEANEKTIVNQAKMIQENLAYTEKQREIIKALMEKQTGTGIEQ